MTNNPLGRIPNSSKTPGAPAAHWYYTALYNDIYMCLLDTICFSPFRYQPTGDSYL